MPLSQALLDDLVTGGPGCSDQKKLHGALAVACEQRKPMLWRGQFAGTQSHCCQVNPVSKPAKILLYQCATGWGLLVSSRRSSCSPSTGLQRLDLSLVRHADRFANGGSSSRCDVGRNVGRRPKRAAKTRICSMAGGGSVVRKMTLEPQKSSTCDGHVDFCAPKSAPNSESIQKCRISRVWVTRRCSVALPIR